MSGHEGFDPSYWPTWVQLLIAGIGVLLIVWPLILRKKGPKS